MAQSITNLIAGPIDVWLAPHTNPLEAPPDFDNLEPPSILGPEPAGNWVQVGFSVHDTDLMLSYTPEYEVNRVNESNAAMDHHLISEELFFAMEIAEKDFNAWNQTIAASILASVTAASDQTGQNKLSVGDGSTLTKYSILLKGLNGDGGSRYINIFKVISVDPSEFVHAKRPKGIPVKFDAEYEATKNDGSRLWEGFDVILEATS